MAVHDDKDGGISAADQAGPRQCHVPIIETLPLEILWRISSHLSTADFCHLRLTCRHLQEALLSPFAAEFFTRKQFMMSNFSLGALADIAASRMGPCLKSLHLGLDQLEATSLDAQSFTAAQRERYGQFLSNDYMSSDREVDLLTRAFRHLSALETVVIRDFDSKTRHRDGLNHPWRSYGAPTIHRGCGINPSVRLHSRRRDLFDPATIFSLVLRCLATAEAKPTSLKVYARVGGQLRDVAFSLPEPGPDRESVARVLGGLRELHLCIQPRFEKDLSLPASPLLRHFLAYTPNLEELRINCANDLNDSTLTVRFTALIRWLGELPGPPPADPAVQSTADRVDPRRPLPSTEADSLGQDPGEATPPAMPISLPELRTLSFGCLTVSAEDLLAVIRKFAPRLQRLELWRLTLIPHDSYSTAPGRTCGCPWIPFFRGLLGIPNLNLTSLMVGNIRGSSRISRDGFIRFVDAQHTIDWKSDLPRMVQYQGAHWRKFVQDLALMYHSASQAQQNGRKALETYIRVSGEDHRPGSSAEIARRTRQLDHVLERTMYRIAGTDNYDGTFFEEIQSEWLRDQIEEVEDTFTSLVQGEDLGSGFHGSPMII